jgi:hypothetical protein
VQERGELPQAMPLVQEGISLETDMIFGWRPKIESMSPPIPLYFDFIEHPIKAYNLTGGLNTVVYQGHRPKNSYQVH